MMYRKIIKRLLDFVLSLSALVILSPLILLLMLTNLIFLGAPVFFIQERIGKNGKTFKMIKFRSMKNADNMVADLESDKKRLTKYGVFLRSTSLDEIPELFNILSGKMSFIGPRPLPTYYKPFYYDGEFERHKVRGGLIPCDGLSKKTTPTWEEQLRYDLYYADHVSFLLDIKVFFITLGLLFKRAKKRYGNIERPHLSEYRKNKGEEKMNYSIDFLNEITNKYGSPLYLFDQKAFEKNYDVFNKTFSSKYPNYKLAYSFKTNYMPHICKIIKQKGGLAEVVSDMELFIARKCGFKDSEIIYNGPFKGEEKYQFIINGGILNCDSFDELDDIIKLAHQNNNKDLNIGVRVNIDVGQKFVSRFGIDSSDLDTFFERVNGVQNLHVIGLHCHVGQSRTVKAWVKRTKTMLSLADKYFDNPPRFIDLGSGMFGELDVKLALQFDKDIPSYDDYSDAICLEFAEHYKNIEQDKKPLLITEPGTTIVNKYIDFITKVYSVKNIKKHSFVVVDGSKHNIGDICQLKQLPLQVFNLDKDKATLVKNASIVGYTCLEHDVIFRNYNGLISKGDYLVFGNVGGYSNVSKPPFILQNCAMICVDLNGKTKLIKNAESPDYILETYEV